MRPTLRPATVDDAELTFAVHEAAMRDVVEATWGPWDDALQRDLHRRWFDPGRLSVVVVDGEDVGVLDATAHRNAPTYLARIELLPRWQGRGVGAAVMGDLIARARDAASPAVELDVLDANHRAQRLYERLGFAVVSHAKGRTRLRLDLASSRP